MRHIKAVTQAQPRKADAFADIFCVVTSLVAGLVGAIGGGAPIVDYLDTKCNFGIPDDEPV